METPRGGLNTLSILAIRGGDMTITLTRNANNLSATGKRPINAAKEPVLFMTRSKLDDMLGKEKEKALVSSIV